MRKKAFTLIELIIVMGIMGIVLASVYSVFSYGIKRNSTESNLLDTEESGRNAIKFLGDAIKNADYPYGVTFSNFTDGNPNASGDIKAVFSPSSAEEDIIDIMHVKPYNNSVTYKYYLRKSTNDLVRYIDKDNYKILINNVNSITVNEENQIYKINVKINIKGTSKTEEYSSTFSIIKRGGL